VGEAAMNRIEKKFWAYHDENPHVFRLFARYAQMAVNAGHKRFSADMVLHRLRWNTMVETFSDKFKINNNYSAYYARLWMRENPEHDGFFSTRVLRSRKENYDHDVEALL
jgi:hypothetical protein